MTCRAGSTLSSEKAYKLQRTAPEPQQDEAVIGWGSAGHAKPNVAGRITVATAAHVPQVCAIDMLLQLAQQKVELSGPTLLSACVAEGAAWCRSLVLGNLRACPRSQLH